METIIGKAEKLVFEQYRYILIYHTNYEPFYWSSHFQLFKSIEEAEEYAASMTNYCDPRVIKVKLPIKEQPDAIRNQQ